MECDPIIKMSFHSSYNVNISLLKLKAKLLPTKLTDRHGNIANMPSSTSTPRYWHHCSSRTTNSYFLLHCERRCKYLLYAQRRNKTFNKAIGNGKLIPRNAVSFVCSEASNAHVWGFWIQSNNIFISSREYFNKMHPKNNVKTFTLSIPFKSLKIRHNNLELRKLKHQNYSILGHGARKKVQPAESDYTGG